MGIHTKEYMSGVNVSFVTHIYFFANINSSNGVFDTYTFKDILEQYYNDTILHFDLNVDENIIIIHFINTGSNNILMIRLSDINQLTGTKYGTYYQYSKEGCMSSQIQFTSSLIDNVYVLSDLRYRSSQRFLVALGTQNTISYTPTGDYNPATKKYVDDLVGNIETLLGGI